MPEGKTAPPVPPLLSQRHWGPAPAPSCTRRTCMGTQSALFPSVVDVQLFSDIVSPYFITEQVYFMPMLCLNFSEEEYLKHLFA